jgi:L-rhamnose mutarotase
MIIETDEDFSFDNKAVMEALMSKFQQALPWAKAAKKWLLMEKI